MINMKLLIVLTPPSIYHGCYTRKTFWEEKFTGKEKLFSAVNMKNFGRRNVRKHMEIKGSDKYVTLDISSKFDSLDKIKITSSGGKREILKIRKGVDYLYEYQDQSKVAKIKKARYSIRNFNNKYLSNIIREFEKFEKLPSEKKRSKHEPTDSYFYLARQLAKCMMRSDTLNWHDYCGFTEMTDLSSNICSTDKDKSKCIIVHKTLSYSCSANKEE